MHDRAPGSTTGSTSSSRPAPSRSSRFSEDLPKLNEPNAYELQPISHSVPPSPRDEDEDDHTARRLSFDSVQSYELYTPDEDKMVLRKLDRRLVGFMALLYCLSFLDRTNIGNARIAGMEDDLKLSSNQFEWLIWAFYITYIGFEWMTLMYRVVPPHIYISICIFSWGIIACLQSVAPSFGILLILRALLGIGEAAFSPGVPFYLSFFFRRRELAFRTGLFISASPLSSAFAGVLAWAITKLASHSPFSPWRLLFLIEGFPSMLVAVWAWSFIPDGPGTIRWLTPRQRKVAVLRLRQEKERDEEEEYQGRKSGGINFGEVVQTLKDPKSYLTAFMFFSCNVAFGSIPVFLPTIIRDMGFESITAQGLTAPPYLVAFFVVIATAYLSDRLQARSVFVIAHSLLAALAYGTIAMLGHGKSSHTLIRYLALYPAISGFFSSITVIITWTINNQDSDSKKGAGMAVLNVIGQFGPLVGTSIFPASEGPWYVKGMAMCAGFMLLVAVLAGILRWVLARENKMARQGSAGGTYAGIPLSEGGRAGDSRVFEFEL
ncbi:MFS general substrate transporter [Didymella exigua CBS 183.55]|uniref:MFS general substrate transporter n=1 Tax=Didymella exigua CBS 183.55 TaxID=1150837 RepID=A0A6A5RK36_9PLEO|nr:MFS general substrate transporter [Didymella exigua CBS 183.55]KAF1927989.1 MFS general substrate transporter [Didymella exigua CBS 183.55]